MKRPAHATAAMLAAVVLAGCQPTATPTSPTPTSPSASTVSPVPTPTYQCTPEAGGEATPCTQIQHEDMKAKDRLYAEAEAVYREYFAENIRISRAGGVTEPTDVILRTTAGRVQEAVMEIFRSMEERGVRAEGDDPRLTIERAVGVSREGSIVALEVCADASGWAFYSDEKLVSEGRPALERVYFARSDDLLKMIYSEGKWVEECPAAGA